MDSEPERPLTAAELFDAVGAGYEDAFGTRPIAGEAVRLLRAELAPGARVLDLGSGTGRPVAADLVAAGYAVTGLDVSAAMVDIARRQVPGAEFVHADALTWQTPAGSWDAVCAFFSFLQQSRAQTTELLARIAGWLAPGGLLALATVPMDVAEQPMTFLGHPVRITSFTAADLRDRVTAAGLRVQSSRTEVFHPDGPHAVPEEELLILARRPA